MVLILVSKEAFQTRKWLIDGIMLSFTAIITHHLRDALRRGLWFWPFGSTEPLSLPMYIIVMISVPIFISNFMRYIDAMPKNNIFNIV